MYLLITIYFIIVNLISFILFAKDKSLAKQKKARIPENTLFLITALGGTIGSLLAMTKYRHKTKKTSFKLKMFFIIVLQIAIIYWLINHFF